MAGSILLELRRGEAAGLRRSVERAGVARGLGISRAEARRLAEGAAQYPGRMRDLWEWERRRAAEEPGRTSADLRATRRALEEVAAAYLHFARFAREALATAPVTPAHRLRELTGVTRAVEELEGLRREIAECWPEPLSTR